MTTYVLAIVPAFVALHRFDTRGTPKQRALLFVALAGQLAWLAYDPTTQIPRAADYAAGRQLVELLRDAPGPVLVPDRPWLAVLAGKTPSYHANTFWEMSFQNRASLVPDDLRQRLASGYYSLVVDRSDPHRLVNPLQWWPRELLDNYRCDRSIRLPGRGLSPVTGILGPGPHVLCTYEPRDPASTFQGPTSGKLASKTGTGATVGTGAAASRSTVPGPASSRSVMTMHRRLMGSQYASSPATQFGIAQR